MHWQKQVPVLAAAAAIQQQIYSSIILSITHCTHCTHLWSSHPIDHLGKIQEIHKVDKGSSAKNANMRVWTSPGSLPTGKLFWPVRFS